MRLDIKQVEARNGDVKPPLGVPFASSAVDNHAARQHAFERFERRMRLSFGRAG